MAALINALDTQTPKQIGENGHIEYTWSNNNLKEKITQFHFQVTRTDESTIESLSKVLRQILTRLQKGLLSNKAESQELLTILYKMIGHTRDIVNGKGEYALSYMMVFVWYDFFPELAMFALEKFVSYDNTNDNDNDNENLSEHPYGSWKDIKYFCNYCKSQFMPVSHPLIQYAFSLLNNQIAKDASTPPTTPKSLASKWTPREKSTKFGWIFQELALIYFGNYLETATTPDKFDRAVLKCKMDYRKVLSTLNKQLNTTQIDQCANTWQNIDHSKTTSITISKQKQAFLNVKKDGSQRSEAIDRIICADKFKERIKKAAAGECEIKGLRVGMELFTILALELIKRKNKHADQDDYQIEMDLLNSQWRNNATQTESLKDMITMVDFSGSMDGAPKHCAYAMGCRVAEKSRLGKRVMSFCASPTWHNLEDCNNFTDMVERLQEGECGYSTNFYLALDRILDAIIEMKLAPADVSNLTLAIFSDMQINASGGDYGPPNMDTIYDVMKKKYAAAGKRLYGIPFHPPHMLFWNLRSTDGFPAMSSQPNVSMMSGFSPALLNHFCENGMQAFESCSPWSTLVTMLEHPRYKCLEDKVLRKT